MAKLLRLGLVPGMLLIGALLPLQAVAGEEGDLRKILTGVDKLWFSNRSSADMTMTVKTSQYERVLKLTYWTEGTDQAMIRINAPAKEKGTTTLKLGQDVYNYLPKIDRTVKVSAALRSTGWMGSHFTNDDLVRTALLGRDFNPTLVGTKKRGKATLLTIDLVPKPKTAIVWTKIQLIVEKEKKIPVSQVFFDERGNKARTITYSDTKQLGGRLVPTRITVTPSDLPGEKTELVYSSIHHDIKLEADFFSLERLKSL